MSLPPSSVHSTVPSSGPSKRRPSFQRRRKLIKPGLQLRLTLLFTGLSALSLALQFVLFQAQLADAALELPSDGERMLALSQGIVLRSLGWSLLACLPLTFLVGILSTFRFAGPVWRFETFLRAVRRGERPKDFKLRKGDQLVELGDLILDATRPLREEQRPEDQPQRRVVSAGLRRAG